MLCSIDGEEQDLLRRAQIMGKVLSIPRPSHLKPHHGSVPEEYNGGRGMTYNCLVPLGDMFNLVDGNRVDQEKRLRIAKSVEQGCIQNLKTPKELGSQSCMNDMDETDWESALDDMMEVTSMYTLPELENHIAS